MMYIDFGAGAASTACQGVLTVLWACAAVTVAVCTAMIYSAIAFHKSDRDGVATRMRSRSAEILWSLIPIGIFLGIAVPAVAKLVFTDGHCGM